MTPLVRKLSDLAIVLAVTAGLSFIFIAVSNSLVAKATLWKSYNAWLGLISRPDIIVTTIIAVIVTMAVSTYQQNRGRK